MSTEEQRIKFINTIAPLTQKAQRKIGKVLPSVAIAMACVESAYGTAGSCKYHSYYGQKVGTGKTATRNWNGTFFTSSTKEEYQIGVHTTINAAFRSYESMKQCVYNFYELLNTSLYSKVSAGGNYIEQMKQIKECGYMTSSTEVDTVYHIIDKYGLTKYDKLPTVKKGDKGTYIHMLQGMYLNRLGYGLIEDGIFGTKTEEAVKAFQSDNNLEVDGIVGHMTWDLLNEVLYKRW